MNALLLHSETEAARSLVETGGLHLSVHSDLAAVESKWRLLEERAVCTAYQSFDWCKLWFDRVGREIGVSVVIVVAEDHFGATQFILPLQRKTQLGCTIIEALTAPLGAYAFGLFDPSFYRTEAANWFENYMANVIRLLPRHDILRLNNIVETVEGQANPLLFDRTFRDANSCHVIDLGPDFDAWYEQKRPGKRRRYLRNRDSKLEALGKLTFRLPTADDEIAQTIKTMLRDQDDRLAEAGILDVFSESERQFFADLALCKGKLLKPFKLELDGHVLAVISGMYFCGTFWAVISSLADHLARKHSPGDYALRHAIKSMCQAGARRYDFSVGDAEYKRQWSDHHHRLHFILKANSLRGLVVAGLMLAVQTAKRIVKNQPLLYQLFTSLRRLLRGQPAAAYE
jgi:CelD/BcsL family acetyltransferase involved in cellulose biosynthesis